MIRTVLLNTIAVFLVAFSANNVAAQRTKSTTGTSYTTALGLGIDFGDGGTYAGPSIKHFFPSRDAGKAEVLFGSNTTQLSAYYQYHGPIPNASGLKYTLGLGGSGFLYRRGEGDFAFRPTAGLDFKAPNVPLEFEFDWRPAFVVTHGTEFIGAHFGLGFRFCF